MGLTAAFTYKNYTYSSDSYIRATLQLRDKGKQCAVICLFIYQNKATRDSDVDAYFLAIKQQVNAEEYQTYFIDPISADPAIVDPEEQIYEYLKSGALFQGIDFSSAIDA